MTCGNSAVQDAASFLMNVMVASAGIAVAAFCIVNVKLVAVAAVLVCMRCKRTAAIRRAVRMVGFSAGRVNDIPA